MKTDTMYNSPKCQQFGPKRIRILGGGDKFFTPGIHYAILRTNPLLCFIYKMYAKRYVFKLEDSIKYGSFYCLRVQPRVYGIHLCYICAITTLLHRYVTSSNYGKLGLI